jgi:membrane associated rhomboid family serine protease
MRLMEDPAKLQDEMDTLCAHYDELKSNSVLEHYSFVPSHPTWYSYITANFLHGGWLHIIGNMWFLWLAGIVLEDAWGRGLYLVVYLVAGAFALQVHALFNAGSNIPVLGASGAVAGLMGAFLVRFPKVRIRMAWLFFVRLFRFSAAAYWLLPLWFLMEIFYGAVGPNSGVAHMAHVGGFAFGMVAAVGIRYSGLEHAINEGIEKELDPEGHGTLDAIHDLVVENRLDDALIELENFSAANPESERALLMLQEVQWRKNNLAAYGRATQQLCVLHLGQHAVDAAMKDYDDMVRTGAGMPSVELWMKLCQALEEKQEFERALGEYQELAEAYPKDRQSLMALMAGARVAMNKVQRPEQAINLYQAVATSNLPHMDLDSSIEAGMKQARAALATVAAAGK